jgi:diketogulonate reductase-like aldo/keto reductase
LPETQFLGLRSMPIPGAKNPQKAQENVGALGWRLSDDAIPTLDEASDTATESSSLASYALKGHHSETPIQRNSVKA